MIKYRKRDSEKILDEKYRQMKHSNKLVAVFGACELGRDFVAEYGEENVLCFIDNDVNKQGRKFWGIPILDVSEYKLKYCSVPIKICLKDEYKSQVISQLNNCGLIYS